MSTSPLHSPQTWLQEPCSTAPQLGQASPSHGYLLLVWKCGHHPEAPSALSGAQNLKYFQPVTWKGTFEGYFLFLWLLPFFQPDASFCSDFQVQMLVWSSCPLPNTVKFGFTLRYKFIFHFLLVAKTIWFPAYTLLTPFWMGNNGRPQSSEMCLLPVKCSCEHSAGSLSSFRMLHLLYWVNSFT